VLRVRKSATFLQVKNEIGGAYGDADPAELPDWGIKEVSYAEYKG
jgi:hypothetical protein